jgi:DNA mismatch repair ATPase MutS
MSVKDKFSDRIQKYELQRVQQQRIFDTISTIRLIVFLAGATLAIACFTQKYVEVGFLVISVSLILFIFLVVKHNAIEAALKKTTNKLKINRDYLDRLEGMWIKFSDSGEDFADKEHPYTDDLDIFGRKSLYQWINIANTFYGRETLRKFLAAPRKTIDEIKNRQNAVKELYQKLEFCQELQCEGMNAPAIHKAPQRLLDYVQDVSKLFRHRWIIKIFYILPAFTVTSLVLFFLNAPISLYVPAGLILIQLIIFIIGYRKVQTALSSIHGLKKDIATYRNMTTLIESERFKDTYLTQLKSNLALQSESASSQIKNLERIADAIDYQNSPAIYFIVNALFLWDYHCLFALEEWKEVNRKYIVKWLQTIGDFEALSSMAVILQINPHWCFPEFSQSGLKILSTNIGHPLISQDKRVCNSIDVANNICIITGSNMSGKTTLLRTLGINLVLAYAGAPVCAERFECSIMNVFTSMRINDNLSDGISTFYAELLRIKMIIDYASKQEPMIFLIDEVFRGTNSRDRLIGARNVLNNLSKGWVIGLISTHDLELCDLEHSNIKIKNYHFTESFTENQIVFDYNLRLGCSHTTNAQYLMKMVGINILD